MPQPFIVTVGIDAAAQAWFDGLRRAHFPSERDHLGAHLTLFHQLPAAEEASIQATLGAAVGRDALPLEVTGVRSLGRGVAYAVASDALSEVRAGLAAAWRPWLTPQDRQPFRAHVTVQNKVAPAEARSLFERLSAGFEPTAVTAEGLDLWRYLGGPWEHVHRHPFRVASA